MTETPDTLFFRKMEPGVKQAVHVLRDYGVNTECSCHHSGYIHFITDDPNLLRDRVRRAMRALGLKNYDVEVDEQPVGGRWKGHVWCPKLRTVRR